MIHASSSATVCEGLVQASQHKNKMAEIGAGGQEWFLDYCVKKPLDYIKKIIRQKEIHA